MNKQKIKIKFVFSEEQYPHLLEISSLLYDFELLHDFSLILCAEEYSKYTFSRYFWFRNGRPIKHSQKLRLAKIVKESPLTIELILAAVTAFSGAFWIFVQALEKIGNWKLNRTKLKQEIERLKLDNQLKRIDLEQIMHEKGANSVLETLLKRLESNPITLMDVDIKLADLDDLDEGNVDSK